MKLFYFKIKHRHQRPASKGSDSSSNTINQQLPLAANSINRIMEEEFDNGPPGRAPSPVSIYIQSDNYHLLCHLNIFWSQKRQRSGDKENQLTTKNYRYSIFNKQKFTSHYLKFTLMKKQIFILVLFVIATFANISKSYGQQATKASDPIPLTCTNDPLNPIAGKEYIYTVAATPAGGTYTWWVTKDPVFYDASSSYAASLTARLTTTTGLTNVSAQYGVPTLETAAASGKEVKITWSTDLLAKTKFQATPNVNPTLAAPSPTFVAVHYAPLVGSCADNFKVFEINPKNGFTIDILNLNPTTKVPSGTGQAVYTYVPTQCFANVTSAKYNAGKMDYLYGVNILYYEVVAANFSGSWTPSFKISNLDIKQTATIEWAYTTAFASPVIVTSNTGNGTYVSPSAASTVITDTSNGVSIYVRVTVTNNSFEGLSDLSLALAVDGKNSSNQLDVVNSTCTDPGLTPDFIDVANQTLVKRPTVVEGTTGLTPNIGIIPKNP